MRLSHTLCYYHTNMNTFISLSHTHVMLIPHEHIYQCGKVTRRLCQYHNNTNTFVMLCYYHTNTNTFITVGKSYVTTTLTQTHLSMLLSHTRYVYTTLTRTCLFTCLSHMLCLYHTNSNKFINVVK